MAKQRIQQLLQESLANDNTIRKNAERQLDEGLKQDPPAFMNLLAEIWMDVDAEGDADDHVTALIHYKHCLKGYFMGSAQNNWVLLSQEHKGLVKVRLLQVLTDPHTVPYMRRAARSLISDLASIQLDPRCPAEDRWDGLIDIIAKSCLNPGNHQAPCLTTLIAITDVIKGDGIKSVVEVFDGVIGTVLSGPFPAEVHIAALRLLCQVAMETDLHREVWPTFQKYLASLYTFMEKTSTGHMTVEIDGKMDWRQYKEDEDEEYDDAVQNCIELLENFIDLTEYSSAFLKPSIEEAFIKIFAIVRNDHIEEDVRRLAMESILYILQDKPKMCNVPGFPKLMIETSLMLMLTVTEEDLGKSASGADYDGGRTEPLCLEGERGIDAVVKALSGKEMFPLLFGYVKGLIADDQNWKKRYVGITCICQTTEYIPPSDQKATLDDLMPVVEKALQDECWMVRLAACRCVGQMSFDLPPLFQVHHTPNVLKNLASIFADTNQRKEVITKALRAYTNFVDELTSAAITPYMVTLLPMFLKYVNYPFPDPSNHSNHTTADVKETAAIRENAIIAISVTASVAGNKFIPFYKEVGPIIVDVITSYSHTMPYAPSMMLGRAHAVDCISHLALAVGKDHFQPDAPTVMETLLRLRNDMSIRSYDPVQEYLYETFKRLIFAMEDNFEPYIEPVLEYYLPLLAARGEMIQDYSKLAGQYLDYSFAPEGDGFVAIKTSTIVEYMHALSLITTLTDKCRNLFAKYLPKCLEAVLPLLQYRLAHEAVSSVLDALCAMLKLMSALEEKQQGVGKGDIIDLLSRIVTSCLELMANDEYLGSMNENCSFLIAVADGLAGCLQNAGKETLDAEAIRIISEQTFGILKKASNSRLEFLQSACLPELMDEEDIEKRQEEAQLHQGFRSSLLSLLGGIMSTHPILFMEVMGDRTKEFIKMCFNESNVHDLCLGLYLCCDVLQFLGDDGNAIWPTFLEMMMSSCAHPNNEIRQAACYGMVWACKSDLFQASWINVLVENLAACVGMNDINDDGVQIATDNGIAAINVLLCKRGDMLGVHTKELGQACYKNFPLVIDSAENMSMADMLLDALADSIPAVLGENGCNIPYILGGFAKMYKTLNSEEDTDKRIVKWVKGLDERVLMHAIQNQPDDKDKFVKRMIEDISEP